MKRRSTCGLLAVALVAFCAAVPASAREARGKKAGAGQEGGTAQGEILVNGKKTTLRYAYAVAGGAGGRGLTILLSDTPVAPEDLESRPRRTERVRSGELRAVEVTISPETQATTVHFFHPDLPAELSVDGVSVLTVKRRDEKRIEGNLVMEDPGFSFGYTADFRTPIYRPQQEAPRAQVETTSPDGALQELERKGLAFDLQTFVSKARAGDAEAVRLFLAAGMDTQAGSGQGRGSALWSAVDGGHAEVARILIGAGADINERDGYGQSLVMRAAEGNLEILKALIAAGADVNIPNLYKIAPLASAAEQGKREAVEALLAAGANVRARNPSGGTALSVAVLRGYIEIVRLLIAAGADVERDRKELLEAARREGFKEIEDLIANTPRGKKK